MKEPNKIIGPNLLKIMSEKRFTSKVLAEKVGISATHLSYIINGKRSPSLELLNSLAVILEVPMSELVEEIYIDNKIFAERFRLLMEENNDTIYTIAEVLHLSAATISRYINNKMSPKITTIEVLARYYSVDSAWLMGYDVPRVIVNDTVQYRIPVLGSIPAGVPVEAVENIIDWEDIPAEWMAGDRDYFALQVTGDSMYPEYIAGDTVIVRKQSSCDSSDDCVVLINGIDATLKRVYLSDDCIELDSVNKMYGKRRFTMDEIKSLPVTILGVVVELRRKKK